MRLKKEASCLLVLRKVLGLTKLDWPLPWMMLKSVSDRSG